MKIHYGSYVVQLGPRSAAIYASAAWAGDGYPAWQKFADEFERLLEFAARAGVLNMYSKELRGRPSQRDSAIEELRVAHMLAEARFSIVEWRPIGAGTHEGEFLVKTPDGQEIFVEVRSPGWEGQVSPQERAAGRLKQPKYPRTEAFYANNGPPLAYAVEKAYPKFAPSNANLLVVSDDLRLPLEFETGFWAHSALFSDRGKFTDSHFENLSAVGIVVKRQTHDRAWCDMRLFRNPFARVALPAAFAAAFPWEEE